jgi:hypothetical protein
VLKLVWITALLAAMALPATAQTSGDTPGLVLDVSELPTRQNMDRRVELSLSQRNHNFADNSLSGIGIGVGLHGRFLIDPRFAVSFSASDGYDLSGSLIEGMLGVFFGGLFGFDLDLPSRGDPDHDLIVGALEYQINDPSSNTAVIGLAGFARGDAIGGPSVDTFENGAVLGAGIDTRLAPFAEFRGRVRYVTIEDFGPDLSLALVTTGRFFGDIEYFYSDPLQSLSVGAGFRF